MALFDPLQVVMLAGPSHRLLGLFLEREADFERRFRAARAAGDAGAAIRAAHDLKSTAGTLGMLAVEPAAAALEQACQDGAPDADIEDRLRKVSAPLEHVIEALPALLAARAP